MNYLKSVLLLSRPINQVFIVLTMLLVRYCIVIPNLNDAPALSNFWFSLLISSIVLISAAGYLINDYFDVKADEINKPKKLIVGRYLKRRKVMATQMMINISGLTLGWFCALKANNAYLFLFHLSAAILLWYYSVYFKKKAFTGNVIVSVLVALVVLMLVAFENKGNVHNAVIWYYAWCYALFAFLSNLVRELIKDAEDIKGDKLIDANTLPIKYGIGLTVKVIILVAVLLTALVVWFSFTQFSKVLNVNFSVLLSLLIAVPFLLIFIFIRKADTRQQFKKLSIYVKLLMFAGILSMLFL